MSYVSSVAGQTSALNHIFSAQQGIDGVMQAQGRLMDMASRPLTPRQRNDLARFGAYLEIKAARESNAMTFWDKAHEYYETRKKKALDRFWKGLGVGQ